MTFNDVTKDSTFYTTTKRFVAWFGAFSDPSSWLSSPLLILRDIHSKFLTVRIVRRDVHRLRYRFM